MTKDRVIARSPDSEGRRDDVAISATLHRQVGLTPRQKQVFELRLQGYSMAEIAKLLGISKPAVHYRLKTIAKKILGKTLTISPKTPDIYWKETKVGFETAFPDEGLRTLDSGLSTAPSHPWSQADQETRDRQWAFESELESRKALARSRRHLLRYLRCLPRDSREAQAIKDFLRYGV